MQYLAKSFAPELLGHSSEEIAEIDMLYGQLKDIKQSITGPCYVSNDRTSLSMTAMKMMRPIVAYLEDKEFLVGT